MQEITVAVIGGGPAGLVTLKTLLEASTRERPITARLFEAEDGLGGTFKYRSYENAELVSSKQLTAFSDHRFPASAGDHISLPDYVEYLHSYVDKFGLASKISVGCRVTDISPSSDNNTHRVTFRRKRASDDEVTTEIHEYTHVAICTGLHVQPNVPHIDGAEFVPYVMHSSIYSCRAQLKDQDVMILGCGETAMDIAYEAIKSDAKSVTMCFRTGFLSFPKVLNRFRVFGKSFGGRLPTYVHHTIRQARLRSLISDIVIKKVLWFLTGTQEGCNQHIGALPNEMLGRSYVFLNKSHRAMPYLNRPYKTRQPFLEWLGNEYEDPLEDARSPRWIDTCTWPRHFDKTGQAFFEAVPERKDWKRLSQATKRPSLLIYCTGYRQEFSWLSPDYPTPGQANVRNIVKDGSPNFAFIGFVRPGVGAIPPIAEQQAMWWTSLITENMAMPRTAGHYKLLARNKARIDYGVDYSTYMSILACDFGGSPGLLELWQAHGFQVLVIYCLAASFPSLYRLTGPYASPVAREVTKTEILDTIMRRGVTGNLFFGFIPMAFYGILNLLAYTFEKIGILPPERPTDGVDIIRG